MWTIINNIDIPKFITHYNLNEFTSDIILYNNQEKGYSFLPRYFIINFPSNLLINVYDKKFIPKLENIEWNPSQKLKPAQLEICNTVNNHIKNGTYNSVGIIKARPGAGKTVMAINLSCITKKKTLIILDNNNLVEQWKSTILNFTNVKEKDIGIIQGPKFDTDNKPFTIAMLQTLISKVKRDIIPFYEKMRNSGFDLVFFDECHKTTCGPKYAQASLFINTKNIIGLSATPFATDIHKILMEGTIGKTIAVDNKYELVPLVYFVKYDSGLSSRYSKLITYESDMLKQRSKFISKLPESIKYRSLIEMLTKQMLSEGHKIIIIVFTVELVKSIFNWLQLVGIESRMFYSKETEIDKENDRIIIATYGFAGAGFDMKQLSGIILATPLSGKKSLIQTIGRVLRTYEGKIPPVVYDLIDTKFGGIFLRDIPKKRSILEAEFKCKFKEIDIY